MKISVLLTLLATSAFAREYDLTQTEGGKFLTNEGAVLAGNSTLPVVADDEKLVSISRSDVIARAQDWVNRKVPYSQSATTGTILFVLHAVDLI